MKEMKSKTFVEGYYRDMDNIDLGELALKRLKKSYERFLYLSRKYSPSNGYGFVHPTYAVMMILYVI